MERVVRLRTEDDESIEKLNALYDKGWKTIFTLPYKGAEFRNQFLIGLEMADEDWEGEKWAVDDEDLEEEEDNGR